jgi:hypothetical protein
MNAARGLYKPRLSLMLWVGGPLLILGTVAKLLSERGPFLKWAVDRVALLGWTLALLAAAGNLVLGILEGAFSTLPGA